MKIEIYVEPKKKVEKFVYFRLVKNLDNIDLLAVNERGEDLGCGILLSITSKGTVKLMSGLSKTIGLKVSKAGYIKVDKF